MPRRPANHVPAAVTSSSAASLTPDLLDSLIILLMAGAITIFTFWLASRLSGSSNFEQLPDWITGSTKGVWTAVASGGSGTVLAILRALRRNVPGPFYLKYVGYTTLGLLLMVWGIFFAFLRANSQPYVREQVPVGADKVDVNSTREDDFELRPLPGLNPINYVLRGRYRVVGGVLKGHFDGGSVEFNPAMTVSGTPDRIERVSLQICYNERAKNENHDEMLMLPEKPKRRNAFDVSIPFRPGATVELPTGDFEIDLPPGTPLDRAWMCGSLWTMIGGFMPAR